MVGAASAHQKAWQHAYRALDHRFAKDACLQAAKLGFPKSIEQFANAFVMLQKQRHDADYDPQCMLSRQEAMDAIDMADIAIRNLHAAVASHRRAFVVQVMLKRR